MTNIVTEFFDRTKTILKEYCKTNNLVLNIHDNLIITELIYDNTLRNIILDFIGLYFQVIKITKNIKRIVTCFKHNKLAIYINNLNAALRINEYVICIIFNSNFEISKCYITTLYSFNIDQDDDIFAEVFRLNNRDVKIYFTNKIKDIYALYYKSKLNINTDMNDIICSYIC